MNTPGNWKQFCWVFLFQYENSFDRFISFLHNCQFFVSCLYIWNEIRNYFSKLNLLLLYKEKPNKIFLYHKVAFYCSITFVSCLDFDAQLFFKWIQKYTQIFSNLAKGIKNAIMATCLKKYECAKFLFRYYFFYMF